MKKICTILMILSMNLVFCQTDLLQNLKTVENTISTLPTLNSVTLNPVQVSSVDIYTYNNYIPVKTGSISKDLQGNYQVFKLNDYNIPVQTYQINRTLNNNLDVYKFNQYNLPVRVQTITLNNITPIKL